MILILLIRGSTLPGATDGIVFYLYPDFKRLLTPQVNFIVWRNVDLFSYCYVFLSVECSDEVSVTRPNKPLVIDESDYNPQDEANQ